MSNISRMSLGELAKRESENYSPFSQNHDPSFQQSMKDAYAEGVMRGFNICVAKGKEASAVGVEESVVDKIRSRRYVGRKKYGTTMERTDLTRLQWMQHAQEEAMDFAIYLEKLIFLESLTR